MIEENVLGLCINGMIDPTMTGLEEKHFSSDGTIKTKTNYINDKKLVKEAKELLDILRKI